jgi:hypothetical protein
MEYGATICHAPQCSTMGHMTENLAPDTWGVSGGGHSLYRPFDIPSLVTRRTRTRRQTQRQTEPANQPTSQPAPSNQPTNQAGAGTLGEKTREVRGVQMPANLVARGAWNMEYHMPCPRSSTIGVDRTETITAEGFQSYIFARLFDIPLSLNNLETRNQTRTKQTTSRSHGMWGWPDVCAKCF